jgi:hypothetical protein
MDSCASSYIRGTCTTSFPAASCYICVLLLLLYYYIICVSSYLIRGKACVILRRIHAPTLRRILLHTRPHATTTTPLFARSHTSCILNVCSHASFVDSCRMQSATAIQHDLRQHEKKCKKKNARKKVASAGSRGLLLQSTITTDYYYYRTPCGIQQLRLYCVLMLVVNCSRRRSIPRASTSDYDISS